MDSFFRHEIFLYGGDRILFHGSGYLPEDLFEFFEIEHDPDHFVVRATMDTFLDPLRLSKDPWEIIHRT